MLKTGFCGRPGTPDATLEKSIAWRAGAVRVFGKALADDVSVSLSRRTVGARVRPDVVNPLQPGQRKEGYNGSQPLLPSRCGSRIVLMRRLRRPHAARRKANPDPGRR